MKGSSHHLKKGFTLIELAIVITLTAILSVAVSVFIVRPINAYTSVTHRATLVDAADLALRRMARDIQRALPNSLRVKISGNRSAIEMVNVVEGMRYRATPAPPYLDFTKPITTFNVLGQFQYALNNATCIANSCQLVVYNTGANTGSSDSPSPGANVYSTVAAPACSPPGSGCNPPPGSYTISPFGTSVTLTNPSSEGRIVLGSAVEFALPSPRQRIDIVDTPVTYICDTSAQTITRYANYAINAVQPIDPTVSPLSGGTSAQLAGNVTACSFFYAPGTAQRNGVISMSITLTNAGESITLMRQVGVDNVP